MDGSGLALGFLDRAQTVSSRVALADDGCALSYAELRTRVLTLGGQLCAAGVVPGDVVAVICDRSGESVVGILAVYAAGAAYLPLDLSYPASSLAQMLETAQPRMVVSVPGAASEVLSSLGLPVVESTAQGPAAALAAPVAVDAASPICVLFTSGSPGRRKGVVLSRRALACTVAWQVQHPRLGQPARVLQFAKLGCDSSVCDLFATFATGGTLIMADAAARHDPLRLLGLLQKQRIERAFLPYGALRTMAEAHANGGVLPGALLDLMTGGEGLTIMPAIRQLFSALPAAVLYNGYGSTESCAFVTSNALSGDPAGWPEHPGVGAPPPHIRTYVVDVSLGIVDDGIEGELLIGGESLADGYINRPRLTAEHFVQVQGATGLERVYRSGDRARRAADGSVVVLGRMDGRYKASGNQVALGEAKSALAVHPLIGSGAMVEPIQSAQTGLPLEFPLLGNQMEKWFASQFGEEASLAFNESWVLYLDGALNLAALQRALRLVWQRHEALRFSFAADGKSQRFNVAAPLPLVELDYVGPAADARFATFCAQQARQTFDLTKAPLVRFTLVRLGEGRRALHVMAHQLVMDAQSLAVFVRELATCYNAFAVGREPELAAPTAFRSYLIGEYARQTPATETPSLDYWRRIYAAPPTVLRLLSDRPAPVQPDYAAATVHYELAPTLTAALRDEACRHGVSLHSLLLSGFGVLLARLSGQHDFAVAVPLADLMMAGNGVLVAGVAVALPLRMQVGPKLAFAELVAQTHAALLGANEHQHSTLTTIQRMLGLRAANGEAALTGVEFNFVPWDASTVFAGLSHTLHDCSRAALDWDMSFNFRDTGETLTLALHYATARYDVETARCWMGFYETLLRSITGLKGATAAVAGTVADVDLLGDAGRFEVLEAWNTTAMPYDREQGVTALIEAKMRELPRHIAAECGGRSIDYITLDRSTCALAHALRRRGISRGELVGVCVPRTLEMLIAVVGVLRSGAAYVPLDPEFPVDRVQYMAEHSGLQYVLVTEAGLLPEAVAASRTLLDVNALVAEPVDAAALPEVHGDDLAYVLYTSGSTGKPKGVGIMHRNLVNFLLGMSREPGFGPDDVLCSVTTLSFDIVGLELYLPLIVGARLVIASEDEFHEAQPLWDLIKRSGCNVLQTTPSLLRLLMDIGRDDEVRNLRLFVGGEALPLEVANSMAGHCREFWNLYGPTETTIWSTVARIQPGLNVVPLGKPIANTRIYVLDPQREPVLPGLIGEIWIGGDGVAAGYLHRPDLTAERFFADPFAGGDARMYRTGDLGTWREGVLYFHGRADDQIKIRGYRIEPGDIEAAADSYPAMRECVVVAYRFGDNDVRLVLYAVVEGDRTGTSRLLRDHLRVRLPKYMLPQHIELLDALPKTPNGKLDRNALPEPSATEVLAHTSTARAPALANSREAYIERVWRELVGVMDIRSSDNFFDIGGHSLLAVEFANRVKRETGMQLRLLDVATSTLAMLALELPEAPMASASEGDTLVTRLRRWFEWSGNGHG